MLLTVAAISFAGLVTVACSASSYSSIDPKFGVAPSERVISHGNPVPRGGGNYKVGNPYKVAGRWFHPREDPAYDEVGLASWYGSDFHGRRTANGEIYDMHALTAAHPTLPMPTYARVTNLENGRSVVVRINDRGPFSHDRLIDLSRRTAEMLGFKHNGTAPVRVQYVGTAPLNEDESWLTTTVQHDGNPAGSSLIVADAATPVPEPGPRTLFDAPDPAVSDGASGQQTVFAWKSGYAPTSATNLVAATFGMFD